MFSFFSRRRISSSGSPAGPPSSAAPAAPQPSAVGPSSREAELANRAVPVVLLLNGDRLKLHPALDSNGALAAVLFHEYVRRYIAEQIGRGSKAMVMLFCDQQQKESEFGQEEVRSFITDFNTRVDFPSVFVDVGSDEGAASKAVHSHMTFHSTLSDYLILGGVDSAEEQLVSGIKELVGQHETAQIALIELDQRDKELAMKLGVKTANFAETLQSKRADLSSQEPPSPVTSIHPALGPIVAELGADVKRPAPELSSPVQQLEQSVAAQDNASFDSLSSPSASPPHASTSAAVHDEDESAPPYDLSATVPFLPEAPPEPADPRSFAEVMKTHPATFAKPKPTRRSRSRRQDPTADFTALLTVIRAQNSRGFDRPLRSQVGAELRQFEEGREAVEKYGGFKEYVKEAERMGLIVLGDAQVSGREWISLAE